MDQQQLDTAISRVIAQEILAKLDTPARDEFLTRSLTAALKDWSVKSAVEKIVAERAAQVAKQLVLDEGWTNTITAAVRQGLELYVGVLPAAIAKTVRDCFHGDPDETSGYRAGTQIAKYLRLPEKTKE